MPQDNRTTTGGGFSGALVNPLPPGGSAGVWFLRHDASRCGDGEQGRVTPCRWLLYKQTKGGYPRRSCRGRDNKVGGEHKGTACAHRGAVKRRGGAGRGMRGFTKKSVVVVCFVPATLEQRDSSTSLVMVLLIEGGLAEEPRAALGGAGGKGHRLQHCIEKDKDNSQTQDTT